MMAISPLQILGFLLILVSTARSELDSDAESRAFMRAQCKAMCLKLFQSPDNAVISKIVNRLGVPNDLAPDCFQNKNNTCSSNCFFACDKPPSLCHSTCSIGQVDSLGCSLGCLLLSDIHANRPGECPLPLAESVLPDVQADLSAPGLILPRPPLCDKLCTTDSSCPHSLHKCCSFGCNRRCTMPIFSDDVPPLPSRLALHPVPNKPDNIQLSWSATHSNFSHLQDPVVYILQLRYCKCKRFSEKLATPWQTIIMAVDTTPTVDFPDPELKYQFRVASVSTKGSRGFGTPSKPYQPSIQSPLVSQHSPSLPTPRPQPPRNVTATKWRIQPNEEVSVRLSWTPPESNDLKLIHYSISWALDNGYPATSSNLPLKNSNVPFVQTVQTEENEITINGLRPDSSYKVQVIAIYFHEGENLESLPHNFFISTQSLVPTPRQHNIGFEKPRQLPLSSFNDDNHDSADCRCSGLEKNDERLEIKPPEIYDADLTALVQLKSFSHMDSQSYNIKWFPQVCIDSVENAPTLTQLGITKVRSGVPFEESEVLKATVRNRIFRLTKLKFNCVYMVWLTPEDTSQRYPPMSRRRQSQPLLSPINGPLSNSADVVAGCFCTRSCRETKTALGTKSIECPAAEPEPPQPPRGIQVELVNYDRLDYQVSWHPPVPTKSPILPFPSGVSHPNVISVQPSPTTFTRYRVLWAPRKEEPVDASMYNDEAGFKPIPDLQHSDVRVLDKNQTTLILPRLRPRTVYILQIQTLGSTNFGRERESPPAVHYFNTHDDGFHINVRPNG
ncbi:unnamed protein product [Rodentolepis nana]|uniref:Anosmin-1 n=1 Tax=Rodentolepis nana TaxID=102285 RepID=A0A158QJ14_RODNA|nr:unnamed protein product [Rodentolepis nana]